MICVHAMAKNKVSSAVLDLLMPHKMTYQRKGPENLKKKFSINLSHNCLKKHRYMNEMLPIKKQLNLNLLGTKFRVVSTKTVQAA